MELLKLNIDTNHSFTQAIYKNDILRIMPTTGSLSKINSTGDIQFQSLQSSCPLDICNAKMYYKIELTIPDTQKLTLQNNWFPSLFHSMRLKIGSSEVEQIMYPGTISTMLNLIMITQAKLEEYKAYGWFPKEKDVYEKDVGEMERTKLYKEKVYEGYYPLKLLFGFLQNYNRLIYNAFIELLLNKQDKPELIFYGKDVPDTVKPKLNIISLELHIPEWTLSPRHELNLLERYTSNKSIQVSFLERICSSQSLTTGTNYSIKLGNLAYKPRYIILGIKKKTATASLKDNSDLFIIKEKVKIKNAVAAVSEVKDSSNVITTAAVAAQPAEYKIQGINSIQIQLNNTYYPVNRMEFNYSLKDVIFPYTAYLDLCQEFFSDPQLNIEEWLEDYPIFCMNVSAQDPKLNINNVDVTLHITKETKFEGDLYWVILQEKHIEMRIAGNKITTIENVKGQDISLLK